jgi:hypothetical protein
MSRNSLPSETLRVSTSRWHCSSGRIFRSERFGHKLPALLRRPDSHLGISAPPLKLNIEPRPDDFFHNWPSNRGHPRVSWRRLGAFGAHQLAAVLATNQTASVWQTAVLYHLVHAVAALWAAEREFHRRLDLGGKFLFFGFAVSPTPRPIFAGSVRSRHWRLVISGRLAPRRNPYNDREARNVLDTHARQGDHRSREVTRLSGKAASKLEPSPSSSAIRCQPRHLCRQAPGRISMTTSKDRGSETTSIPSRVQTVRPVTCLGPHGRVRLFPCRRPGDFGDLAGNIVFEHRRASHSHRRCRCRGHLIAFLFGLETHPPPPFLLRKNREFWK